jgi:hypothetical protein
MSKKQWTGVNQELREAGYKEPRVKRVGESVCRSHRDIEIK